MINTTSTNVNTEQNEKPKATPFLEQISLRDYFAAKAMAALISCAPNHGDLNHDFASVDAYRYADAMIKTRSAV